MKTVLLIDDSLFAVKRHKKILENFGYFVESASSGDKGLEKFKEINPDIVFLDLLMPDIDGYQVLKELKTEKSNATIVVVSADIQNLTKEEVFSLGADDFIGKPLTFENVSELLNKITVNKKN